MLLLTLWCCTPCPHPPGGWGCAKVFGVDPKGATARVSGFPRSPGDVLISPIFPFGDSGDQSFVRDPERKP